MVLAAREEANARHYWPAVDELMLERGDDMKQQERDQQPGTCLMQFLQFTVQLGLGPDTFRSLPEFMDRFDRRHLDQAPN